MNYYETPKSRFSMSTPVIFIAGIVVGIFLGWVFDGLISILIRLGFVALLVVAALYLYGRWKDSKKPPDRGDGVWDADWRDLDPRRRR